MNEPYPGDVVLLNCNRTIGRIKNCTFTAGGILYNVQGVDGTLYRNQHKAEIVLIRGLSIDKIEILRKWLSE